MRRVVPLRYGVAFRKAFGDPEVFSAFASDILGLPIHVDRVEPERSVQRLSDMVKVEYDLFAEDAAHRIIVEVQHIREDDFLDRFLYYHLFGMMEQVRSHEDYRFARDVYTVVVLTRRPRKIDLRFSVASMDMDPVTEQGQRLGAFRHRMVLINPREINERTPPGARRWMELIADSLDEQIDETRYTDPLMRRIVDAIGQDALSGEELAVLKDEAVWENAKRLEREEGEAAGLQKGRSAGLREAVVAICEVLAIELTDARRAAIDEAPAETLAEWLDGIKRTRAWPGEG